jgi:uncharacterized membrane protein YphA (DoxX/SURF4 family)
VIVGALSGAAAVLLIVAGLAKLRTPAPAAAMIASFSRGLRRPRLLARVSGAVECLLGVAALTLGSGPALIALAAGYAVLTAVAVRLATRPQRTACGCFGTADGAVGAPHVVFDLACLAGAVAGAIRPPGPATALFDSGPLIGVTVTGQALLLAVLGYLSITALPALVAARREVVRKMEGIR